MRTLLCLAKLLNAEIWRSLLKLTYVLLLGFVLGVFLHIPRVLAAASTDGMWAQIDESKIPFSGVREIKPRQYRTVVLQSAARAQRALGQSTIMYLPLPSKALFGRFRVEESPIMDPALAARYPELRTYRGIGLDDRTATLRMDITPAGYHAIILSANGTILIDPYQNGDAKHYITYFARALDFQNLVPYLQNDVAALDEAVTNSSRAALPLVFPRSGENLRTYRVAMATTGGYTASVGGTKADGMAAVVTILNRVNAIYEREVAIRMVLVADNDKIIYTDPATDPYTDEALLSCCSNSTATIPCVCNTRVITENQTKLDTVIGSGNYDIGHVLNVAVGGWTSPSGVCTARKARSTTSTPAPPNHLLTSLVVAHEMGHQFGANHTWDGGFAVCGTNQRHAATAYEPGSGTTIMSYAGLCGRDAIQPIADPYFHSISLDEIINYTTSGGGSACGTLTPTGNTPPAVNAGMDFQIPFNTPFTLTGSATDIDGDPIRFSWEQFDLRSSTTAPSEPPWVDQGDNPLFRSFPAVPSPSRTFPQLSDILNNQRTVGEALPTTDRIMNFRLIARDIHLGIGGVASDSMTLNVTTAAGPFKVTFGDPPPLWIGHSAEQVSWDVAHTDTAPINCKHVNILLSCNGGRTFMQTLAANTPNDGAEMITVPNVPKTSGARIKVECADNVFFDISDFDFTISPTAGDIVTDCTEDRDMELLVANFAGNSVLRFDGQKGGIVSTFIPILNNPTGLTFGLDGNLYVSNSGNNSVRRFDGLTGKLTNIFVRPGSGGLANAKSIVFGPDANLYVISLDTNSILRYDGMTGAFLGTFVQAGSGGLEEPRGLTFGPGNNLYVSSNGTSEILRYDGRTGSFLDAFVTAGSGGLDGPEGLVFGSTRIYGGQFASDDNLYVASGRTNSVLRFDWQTGAFLDVFVAPGSGGLQRPKDLGFWPCFVGGVESRCLQVTNTPNATSGVPDSVLRYDAQTGVFIDVFVTADSDGPDNPAGLYLFNNKMYVGSSATNAVRRYDGFTNGDFFDDFVASGTLNKPLSLVRGPDGKLYVSSFFSNSVLRFDGNTGAFLDVFVAPGSGGLNGPFNMAFGPDGNLYVSSRNTDSVLRYDRHTGDFIDAFVPAGSGGLVHPNGILFGPQGNLYIASEASNSILRYNGQTGVFMDTFVAAGVGGLDAPANMRFGPDQNLYVSSSASDSILRYSGANGTFIDAFVTAGSGGLDNPQGLKFGPDGNLYVASLGTNNVLRYQAGTGAFVDVFAASGLLNQPTDLVFIPITNMPLIGNYDGDADVDRDDLKILLSEINVATPESSCGIPCDLDRDGVITVKDARKLVLLCTRPRCAVEEE